MVIMVLTVVMLGVCTCRVPAGYVAVQYHMNGGVTDKILTQGWHLVNPTVHTTTYTIAYEQSYLTKDKRGDSKEDDSFIATSKEGKSITMGLAYTYQFKPENVVNVFTRFKGQSGIELRDSFIRPNIVNWTKEVTSQYTVAEIRGEKLAEINTALTKHLAAKFEKFGITIDNVSIADADIDEATEAAINSKIQAQQKAEQQAIENQTNIDKAKADAEAKVTTAQAEADACLIKAKAEAEANNMVRNSINDALCEYKKVETWNGQNSDTVVYGNSAGILLNPNLNVK